MATRREFLAGSAPALLQVTRRARNILLLIADDLGLHTGEYGDSFARTPNLDRLAREGVRFTHGFCTTASCSPSRSVLLTGLHNHASGQYGLAHSVHNFSLMAPVKTLPRVLKEAGYRTGVIGKLHVNTPEGFGWNLDSQAQGRDVQSMARRARSFLQAAGDQPWYLHVGFNDPHRDRTGFANQAYSGVTENRFDPAKVPVPSFLPDNPEVRGELAEYYQSANRLDQGVGMMLDVLRETGRLDNTLVIFLSDNGIPFPNAKTNVYDAGVHLPLIVRSPDQSRRGLVNQAMLSWVDIFPTAVEWAGAKLPERPVHGRSFLSILEQPNPAGWQQVFLSHTFHEVTMYYPMRAVRTRQYKYIRNLYPELEYPHASDLWRSRTWQSVLKQGDRGRLGQRPVAAYLHRPAEELYDITKDPDEVNNLAGAPEHRAALEELRADVYRWRRRAQDPWTLPETYKGEQPGDSPEERAVWGKP